MAYKTYNNMSIYGSRQKSTSRKSTNLDAEQSAAVASNTENLDNINDLASRASEMDTNTLMAQMEKAFPGYSDLSGKAGQIIQNWMTGDAVDKNLQDKMAARAAARNISTGTAGSQFAGFQELRNYGTTLMGVQQQGVQMFQSAAKLARQMINPMSVTSMFQTPQQRFEASSREADRAAEMDAHNAAMAAMPDPGAVAAADEARMNRIGGIQQRNALAMQNAYNFSNPLGSGNPFTGGLRGRWARSSYGSWRG